MSRSDRLTPRAVPPSAQHADQEGDDLIGAGVAATPRQEGRLMAKKRKDNDGLQRFALVLSVVLTPAFAAAQPSARRVPYDPTPLPAAPEWICIASDMAAGGFWKEGNGIEAGARFEREDLATIWVIGFTVDPSRALVVRSRDPTTVDEADLVLWRVESTPAGAVLLTPAERRDGVSPETITIDPATSSFVYSSQHVNPLWNRANIWYGTCSVHDEPIQEGR